jgi:hypothetical protein
MPTPFGPQLIGETEKTLNALLRRCLDGTGLTEPQWVALRIAESLDDLGDDQALIRAVADRAYFPDPTALVHGLHRRGLVLDGQLTDAGRDRIAQVKARIATTTAPIWEDLPPDDVASTTRVLNEVVTRARAVLG